MFGSLDISTSALVAQRQRMEIIQANMANMNSAIDPSGNNVPFRRRIAVFAAGDPSTGSGMGVHLKEVALDQSPFRKVLDPGNPLADKDGYVLYPNIDSAMEHISALEAARAYEANITAAEATKAMLTSALRILA